MDLSRNIHLTNTNIIKSGSFFTPNRLVELVYDLVKDYINENSVIGDFGAGYGAFANRFNNFRCFATEEDEISFRILKENFSGECFLENSLIDINRYKYNLEEDDELIVVGNPPYNDTTSLYKKGEKGECLCDKDISSRDLGITFLKMYDKLKAKYICVLHPLAYLIKRTNFNSLKSFKDNYKLVSGIIFSSKEFSYIKGEFPVVAALYERDSVGMNYDCIRDFTFHIFESKKMFKLSDILTIDGIVEKYPKKASVEGLGFYTLRDMNALFRNADFVENRDTNTLEVNIENLYQYAWLYFLKKEFDSPNKFLYGNLSPLWSDLLNNEDSKRQVISYAYFNNRLIPKYFSKEEIENYYGKMNENYDILYNELNRLKSLFD